MKNLRGCLPLKIAAVVVSLITVAATVFSVVGIGILVLLDFYSRPVDSIRMTVMSELATNELNNAYWHYTDNSIEHYYEDKNIIVTISSPEGEKLYSNDDGKKYICEVSESFENVLYFDEKGNSFDYYNEFDGEFYYVRDWNHQKEDYEYVKVEEKKTDVYDVSIKIPDKLQFSDRFWLYDSLLKLGATLKNWLFVILAAGVISSIIVLSFLFASCGHKDGSDVITPNFIDRIPFEIPIAAVAAAYFFGFLAVVDLFYDWKAKVIATGFIVIILYYLTLGLLLTFATRAKLRTLFKNTICFYVLRFILRSFKRIGKTVKYMTKGIPTVWKVSVIMLGILISEFIGILAFGNYYTFELVVLWVVRSLIVCPAVILISLGFYRLKKGSERMALGELDSKINKSFMPGDLGSFADSLNNIGDGLSYAVDEKMRSERLKTELITNVSHDIKTPLTSIINYVDLIKKENIEDEKLVEYIDVLDRQSIRLKKLIEDLVEASKASTGNLSVELTNCDAGVLLAQAAGEFDEKLKTKNLTLVLNTPEEPARILADGRRLWRVFDNLLNNICKYAQSGTRVYLDLKKENGKTVITFKNISEFPLNITGEELTERFVRGDRSRNTEGSGLGLSIAKSLVELQGGEMNIIIDGDLFKAEIIFN